MVQAHTGPVFSEPDLSQIVSLCDPLDTPFGAVDGCGYFLYINPALEALMEQCGGVDSSTRLGEWIDTSSPCPALETSGNISMNALPFLGRIWLKMEDPASEPVAALLRLEAYGGNGAGFPAALCTIMPYPQASLTLSPAPLLRRWKSRVEEIGDSFDIARVGAKTCKVLESMTQATPLPSTGCTPRSSSTARWRWSGPSRSGRFASWPTRPKASTCGRNGSNSPPARESWNSARFPARSRTET